MKINTKVKLVDSALKTLLRFSDACRLNIIDKRRIVPEVRKRNLTYLNDNKLIQLIRSLNEINEKAIEGDVIEAGCALGGSLIVISAYLSARRIHEYDTFGMIPPPSESDPRQVHDRYTVIKSGKSKGISGDVYYGYRENLLDFVRAQVTHLLGSAALANIQFHPGLLEETMRISKPVAFAHIDVDWHGPVNYSLQAIWPKLTNHGIIIFDDYFDWGGCKKAVDDFFSTKTNFKFDCSHRNLKVTKILAP